MNLKQLISSRWKVVSSRWNTSKKFTDKPLGNIIDLDFDGTYNAGTKTWRFDMSITAKTQKRETIRLYDNVALREGKKRKRDKFITEPVETISTHTCTIVFKDIEEIKLNLKEIEESDVVQFEQLGGRIKTVGGRPVPRESSKRKELYKDIVSQREREILNKYNVVRVSTEAEENETGIRVFRTPISLQSQVNVRCTCANFYYAFAWYNADNNCLVGSRPPAYEGYDNGEKEVSSLNENENPGFCKHLELLIATLLDQDVLGTNNYNDRFIGSISPTKFVEGKLKRFGELKEKTLERRDKVAKEELKDFLHKMRLKAIEVKTFRNAKKNK